MKRLLSTIIIIIVSGWVINSYSQSPASENDPQTKKIKWYDFEEAVAANKKHPKKLFLDMYTSWCKRMDQTTFLNPVIVDYMNKNFYAVHFNAERKDTVNFQGKAYVNANPANKRSSHQLAQMLLHGRMSYPSFVFLNEKQELITVVPGYRKPSQFESILVYIGDDVYKTKKWEEFNSTFKPTATDQ